MRPDDVRQWLQIRPFEPFRIHLTNGVTFDIRHPDQATVGPSAVTLAQPASEALTQRTWTIALLHITHIEPLPPLPAA
jgi:hypothetical protein